MLLSVAVFLQQLHWLAPAAVMFGTAPCFLMVWWPTRLLTAVLPKRVYRRADDFMFSTYIRMMLFFFENCTGIEVVLYGDVDALLSTDKVENAVYISNHQSTVDWILGCSVALRRGALSRCRYVVKDGLKYFPLYGFYLSQHETLFIKRAGKFQAEKAERQLRNMVKYNFPMWMVVFPEGTRYNPELKEVIHKSHLYSRQHGSPELQHVLCPRTKATQVCLRELSSHASCVYDVTIAYNNTRCPRTGHRTTSPSMPDFLSGYSQRVHIHISRVPMGDVPTDDREMEHWLNARFQFKEKLLENFYSCEDQAQAAFPGEGRVVPLSLRSTFPSLLLWGGAFAVCMAFRETRSVYWKTGLVSLVVGLGWVSVKS
ncbi:1-acyl-sn-glycerol-3-phosphate acyltransferase epsilon-like [Babylonia areolata]|uniref:1-acyl-sn-glycerol-3-phosphate acyltransferase epsilon-like n=1 Tax=Babylonia areolata TaxID=304850 RepID=UPI003FD69FA1